MTNIVGPHRNVNSVLPEHFAVYGIVHGLLGNTAAAAILENKSMLGLENYATRMRWANI